METACKLSRALIAIMKRVTDMLAYLTRLICGCECIVSSQEAKPLLSPEDECTRESKKLLDQAIAEKNSAIQRVHKLQAQMLALCFECQMNAHQFLADQLKTQQLHANDQLVKQQEYATEQMIKLQKRGKYLLEKSFEDEQSQTLPLREESGAAKESSPEELLEYSANDMYLLDYPNYTAWNVDHPEKEQSKLEAENPVFVAQIHRSLTQESLHKQQVQMPDSAAAPEYATKTRSYRAVQPRAEERLSQADLRCELEFQKCMEQFQRKLTQEQLQKPQERMSEQLPPYAQGQCQLESQELNWHAKEQSEERKQPVPNQFSQRLQQQGQPSAQKEPYREQKQGQQGFMQSDLNSAAASGNATGGRSSHVVESLQSMVKRRKA